MKAWIVLSEGSHYNSVAVVAPTGYYLCGDGTIKRDGTPSPEMGPIQNAYRFSTHRKAARTAGKLAFPIIKEIEERGRKP